MRSGAVLSLPVALWGLALACALPEVLLSGADAGLWGSARWRPLAYQNGALWPGLLFGWTPNYAAQPLAMFATHVWLHAGPVHLAGNLAVLAWLAPAVIARDGSRGFALRWTVAMLAGALGYVLLATSPAPMVGMSGALFGLAGDRVASDLRALPRGAARWRRAGAVALALIGLHVVAGWAMSVPPAWQAHLGGFLAGLALAPRIGRSGNPAAPR